MTNLDLDTIRRSRVLRPATQLDRLAIDHVRFDGVRSGGPGVERALWNDLLGDRARVAVLGPSGAGKSSVIAAVLADLERTHDYLALVIRAGNAGEALKGSGDFAQFVLREIIALIDQAESVSEEDREALRIATADKTENTAPQIVGAARLGVALVVDAALSAELRGAITKQEYLKNSTTSVDGLQHAIEAIKRQGREPVLVIDDTDKFAGAETGEIDEEAANGLFGHGVPLLGAGDAHLVVAIHPRFRGLASYKNAAKHFTSRVEIPDLPDPRGLISAILKKRMRRAGLTAGPEELFSPDALAYLEAWYDSRPQDVRTVLRIADQAVSAAALGKEGHVTREHVISAARDVRESLPY